MKHSSEINVEIYTLGNLLFNEIRNAVTENATYDELPGDHTQNKNKLNKAIYEVIESSTPGSKITKNELWQIFWQRIVYAGTLSSKATSEIASMKSLIPFFSNIENFDTRKFIFDKNEWNKFVDHWKSIYKKNWLKNAKNDPDWAPLKFFVKTTPEVWNILIKDEEKFPGLRFSTLTPKLVKYFSIAASLHKRKISPEENALFLYTEGHQFSPTHLTGIDWLNERKILDKVKKRFKKELGELTALHAMMDLGLKVIKPDRVMTYLFSQLGWLQTLPDSLSKEEVLKAYMQPEVIHEMSIRSDVLANCLAEEGLVNTHRLLDIWLVKYGQEPDSLWGITKNLQNEEGGIKNLFNKIKIKHPHNSKISIQKATELWPEQEFFPIDFSQLENSSIKFKKYKITKI